MTKEKMKQIFDEINSYEKCFVPTDSLRSERKKLLELKENKDIKKLSIFSMINYESKRKDIHLEMLLKYDLKYIEYFELTIKAKHLNADVLRDIIEKHSFKYCDLHMVFFNEEKELLSNELFTCTDSEFYKKINNLIRAFDFIKPFLLEFPNVRFMVNDMFLELSDSKEVKIVAVRHVENMEFISKYYFQKVDFCMIKNDSFYVYNKKKAPQIFSNFFQKYPDIKVYPLLEYTPNELIVSQYDFIDTCGKYEKNYEKVMAENEDADKNFMQTLMFSLLKRNIDSKEFTPSKESLFKLIKCSVAPVRKEAFRYFDEFYPQQVGIKSKSIFISGLVTQYKLLEIKEKLFVVESEIVKKIEDCDLIVLGNKSKLTTLQNSKELITATYFESLLHEVGEKILENNEQTTEKLEELLSSTDDANTEIALKLMIDGGLDEKLISTLFAIFKTHANSKIRKIAKEVLTKNPSTLMEEVMALIGKKNIASISDEKKVLKLYETLSEVKGFDIEIFKQKVALYCGLGAFLFTEDESDIAREIILKHFNSKETYLWNYKLNSSHFLEAKSIMNIRCAGGDIIWKMNFIEEIQISSKESITLNAKELRQLKELSIYSKSIELYEKCISKNRFTLVVDHINHMDKNFALDASQTYIAVKEKLDLFSPFISKRTKKLTLKTKELVINDDFCDAIENSNIKEVCLDFKKLVIETAKTIDTSHKELKYNGLNKKLNNVFVKGKS